LFFQQNPKPNCYWRQLPIDVDLAAMETHQTLIGELLEEILLPNQFNINELSFENRYGLRYDEPILRLRFLSEREQTPYGNDISLPFSQLHTLEKSTFEKIFFLTDKSVFLTFPNLDDALAIFWEHPNNLLTKIPFLSSSQCYFIGDIAPKTFEQLAQLREGIPSLYHLQSLLLDKNTFDAFPQHHQTQKITTSTFLSNLNRDEQDFYQFLSQKEDKNTLLQKHISYAFLKKSVLFQ
jgi:hypothetical protein